MSIKFELEFFRPAEEMPKPDVDLYVFVHSYGFLATGFYDKEYGWWVQGWQKEKDVLFWAYAPTRKDLEETNETCNSVF